MSLLKQLLLNEVKEVAFARGTEPVDLQDIVKNFPITAKKAARQLWGQERFTYKGLPFIEGENSIYSQLDSKISAFCNSRQYSGVSVTIDLRSIYLDAIEYEDNSDLRQYGQECYLAYSPSNDKLYVAYDSSLNEDIFIDEFNSLMKEAGYKEDTEDYDTAYDKAWKAFSKLRPYVVLEMVVIGKVLKIQSVVDDGLDGFYNNGRNRLKAEYTDLIELRLD